MKLQQVIFYCHNLTAIQNSEFLKDLKSHNVDLFFFQPNSKAANVSAILKDRALLLTDLPDGKNFSNTLHVPYLGKYDTQNPFDYSDAVSLFEEIESLSYSYVVHQWYRAMGLPITICNTEHIIIRELTMEDIPHLYHLYQNPENTAFLPERGMTLEEEIEHHRQYQKCCYEFLGYGLWGIFLKDNTLIGHAGIQNINFDKLNCPDSLSLESSTPIELCYLIDKSFQKQGYAREAVYEIYCYASKELEIEHLACFVAKNNLSSVKLAMDMGMKPYSEGIYQDFPCRIFVSEKLSDWIPFYEKERKRTQAARYTWREAQRKPIQSVYKKLYKRNR